MAWLSGWTYRKSITLTHASGALTNYQMKLLVGESSGATGEDVDCNSHVLSSFNDLRFTASDGTTLLDYWIESLTGSTPNQLATVWIKFNSIGTGATTFYMYYGKADATTVSNGVNTFLFFDDFSGGLSKWTNVSGTASISSGRMLLDATEKVVATSSFGATCAMSARVQVQSNVKNALFGMSQYSGGVIFDTASEDAVYIYAYGDGHLYTETVKAPNREEQDCGAGTNDLSDHRYDILIVSATSTKFYKDGSLLKTHTTRKPDAAMYPAFQNVDNTTLYIDNVYVRQYLATEPAWGSWGAEEGLVVFPSVNVGGSWKSSADVKLCVGEAWKEISQMKINVGGAWKDLV